MKPPIQSYTKKILLLCLLIIGGLVSNAQTITVDDTGYSPQDLVDLLISSSCATSSNISISSNQSVAYFNGNGSLFPINEGIIIRSGIASNTAGLYTNTNLNTQVTTNGDADLQAISDQTGQSSTITDAAFLQFDFVPSSTNFSFDFLFASNEYGEWQCGFSDVFAFLLTDLSTGETVNLAVVPGTSTPISVRDIRDSQFNSSCTSVNPELFSTYNVNDPASSTLNMRGHTVVLNASSPVTPNSPYRIKLVIGDYNDSDFDSAVFIEAGSFDNALTIGDDQTICAGDSIFLDSGFTNTADFSYEWQRDGNTIVGETNPSLLVTQAGTYELILTTLATGCTLTDQAVISELSVNPPLDLLECDSGGDVSFNLTVNDHSVLGIDPSEYNIFYYNSLDNANNDIPIDGAQLASYSGTDGEIIYMRVRNINTNNICDLIEEFTLSISDIEAGTPDDFEVCEGIVVVDLRAEVESDILNGLDPSSFTVSYHQSEILAELGTNPIPDPTAHIIDGGTDPIIIWARLEDNDTPICYDVVSFTINKLPAPEVDELDSVFVCTEYTLPPLTNGNYFTGSAGTGTPLFAGDIITEQTTLFIYAENTDGCTNQSSFTVNMADEFTMRTEYCSIFQISFYPNAQFYTEPGGPNGTGTVIPTGTDFTEDVTIYFYATNASDNSLCAEFQFDITVVPRPTVEVRNDVITCDSYTLPAVLNGERYFTGSGATGTELFPNDVINSSQDIFLYAETTNPIVCSNESSYRVDIIDTNVFQNEDACGEYIIPNTQFGGYFTQPMGAGNPLAAGSSITSSQTIFYYAPEVTTAPNCTDNIQVDITINPIPPVDSLADVVRCEDDPFVLQPLVNGQYFTESGGLGTQLLPGDQISTSQTVYIYNSNAFCDAETSFEIEIRPFPPVDNFTDIFSCEPYTLPVLANGQYFSQSNGQGMEIPAGTVIEETQTLYIFNEYSDLAGCTNENVFTVEILGIEVDQLEDVNECLSYELPVLTVGNYFTEPDGEGTQLNAGDIITTSQTLYIYAENGDRFVCTDERVFNITIFQEPPLPPLPDLESCESLDLPVLDIPGVVVEYYRRPNREDLIDPSEYTITALGSRIIYVYAYQAGNPDCFIEDLFQVTVYPLRNLEIEGGTICINSETGEAITPFVLESGLDPNEFTVNWFLNDELVGTGSNYPATVPGTYTAVTTKLTTDVGDQCNYASTEVVVNGSAPQFEISFLTDAFADLTTIDIITVDPGLGFYEFSLDGGPFQEFLRFYNVTPGDHVITVRDLSGLCGDFTIEFSVLGYPKFFTPNDDGINDTWNIPDLRNDPNARIKIYNKHGRLVAEIEPSGLGWNGYNNSGKKEPSSDYWFLLEFDYNGVPTKVRGHFALLRR